MTDEAFFVEGDLVEYRPGDGTVDRGFVTSRNHRYVFVRFGTDVSSKACDPRDITRGWTPITSTSGSRPRRPTRR